MSGTYTSSPKALPTSLSSSVAPPASLLPPQPPPAPSATLHSLALPAARPIDANGPGCWSATVVGGGARGCQAPSPPTPVPRRPARTRKPRVGEVDGAVEIELELASAAPPKSLDRRRGGGEANQRAALEEDEGGGSPLEIAGGDVGRTSIGGEADDDEGSEAICEG
jgi:hypothetical protein